MGTRHSPADDLVYNLVSIQYHALKATQHYDQFVTDAEGHEEVQAFIRRCQEEDAQRAVRCHELLRELTKEHGLAGAEPES